MPIPTDNPQPTSDAWLLAPERPGFVEPWQAEIFAYTHALCQRGLFSWSTWAEFFAAAIATHPQQTDETIEQAYFRQWLVAFETLLVRLTDCGPDAINTLASRWREAYLRTPHGQPVELSDKELDCAAFTHPLRLTGPIAVSPPIVGPGATVHSSLLATPDPPRRTS